VVEQPEPPADERQREEASQRSADLRVRRKREGGQGRIVVERKQGQGEERREMKDR
jgi:hypothetical protein